MSANKSIKPTSTPPLRYGAAAAYARRLGAKPRKADMRVHLETLLPCSVDQAWEAIQSSLFLMEVTPGDGERSVIEPRPMPARWTDVRRIVLRLPGLGERTIDIVRVDAETHIIQTQERDSVVSRWDHTMQVREAPQGRAYYSDTVDIEAGGFTLPIYVLAQCLYRYRHRGWLRIATRIGAQPSVPPEVTPAASRRRGRG
jgi:hypothetical protein